MGENVSLLDFVIQKDSDDLWYKANATYASQIMGSRWRRGIIFGGSLTMGGTAFIMRRENMSGFTGLSDQDTLYAATSAGGLTTPLRPSACTITRVEGGRGFELTPRELPPPGLTTPPARSAPT